MLFLALFESIFINLHKKKKTPHLLSNLQRKMFSRNDKDSKNGARLRKGWPGPGTGTAANSSTIQVTAQQTSLAREQDDEQLQKGGGEHGLKSWHEIRKFFPTL